MFRVFDKIMASRRRYSVIFFRLAFFCLFIPHKLWATLPSDTALTLYVGQGIDKNISEIPYSLITWDMDFEYSYFSGLGYYHPFKNPDFMQSIFNFVSLPESASGMELILAKHFGLQKNWESDLAYVVRLSGMKVFNLSIGFASGFGLSYAWSTPHYEDGPKSNPQRRYRLQNYLMLEFEWGLVSYSKLSLVTRLHHRSGAFGLLAPRRVGSNFLTAGLRYAF